MIARLLLLLTLLCAVPGWADRAQIGPNEYQAGIPSEQFVYFAAAESAGRQRSQNWCWAACIQMVLNYHGLYVQQEDIVRRVFGSTVDAPAGPQQILMALSGWAPDQRGGMAQIQADARNLDPVTVIQDLEYRWPLIVGLTDRQGQTGHAYVMTAVYYHVEPGSAPIIYRVVLRDPYPTRESRVELTAQDFMARCTFMTRVHVLRS